ncbi:hypothetical protein GCM10027598_82230 [Amycolatopsis oliviviridis]|uniref:Peptidase inhibitor family I36 n=1 Tax=Amycolatopsis oliviviridis TaxID=1471590 RepID=A0ABQ3L654_9PSEU|nr:peptidase inhibitor family I36 protein [Amycolatopsis oliviviridis]GHH06576.1 hypothetical protein GCM10017790_12130 [Amycolatopsis oliviviridis]
MNRTSSRLAVLVFGGVALAGSFVAPAMAAPSSPISVQSWGDCPANNVCVWTEGNFAYAPTAYGSPAFRTLNAGDHDRVSSWGNKTRYQYCLWDNGNKVLLDTLPPNRGRHTMPDGTNDRADAIGRC